MAIWSLVVGLVKKALPYVLPAVGEWIGRKLNPPVIETPQPVLPPHSADYRRQEPEADKINRLEGFVNAVNKFQNEFSKTAEAEENRAKNLFATFFDGFISRVEADVDGKEFRDMLERKLRTFDNIIRNEVNARISLADAECYGMYKKYCGIDSCFDDKINAYAQNVLNEAQEQLKLHYNKSVREMGEFIKNRSEELMQNELNAINSLKEKLECAMQDSDKYNEFIVSSLKGYAVLAYADYCSND